jgi:Domain of unknown function (DUF4389)
MNETKDRRMYPELIIYNIEHPNRWLAIPFIGFIIRIILIIPPAIVSLCLGIVYFVLLLILPFVILFTGNYWETAYKYSLMYLRYSTKIGLYVYGLTDIYPGFTFDESGIFTLRYDKPANPSRFLAFPVLGFLIRIILLIPYIIYVEVLGRGVFIGLICSWFVILFTGRYPESIYEFMRDTIRVSTASGLYMSYLSDTYPSFRISMNHKVIKIILLILGILLLIASYSPHHYRQEPNNMYNYNSAGSNYGNFDK